MKKIAIISSSFPPYSRGGIASAHYNLYKTLKEKGYIVKVFTFGDHGIKKDINDNEIYRFGTHKWIHIFIHVINLIFSKLLFNRKKIAYQSKDILTSALGSIRINPYLDRYRPNVLIVPDHGCPGFFIKRPKNCKTLFISHHNPIRFINNPLLNGFHSEKDARLALKIENKSLEKVDQVICPSRYMKRVFEFSHCFDGHIHIIPNIVNYRLIDSIHPHDLRTEMGLSKTALLIYIPSAGSPFKGSRYVFEIIRRLGAASEDEIGFFLSGTLPDELKYELKFLNKNIKFFNAGYLPYHKNISIIKACSFAVSPTLIESFGMAIIEANYCGLPVIAFDVGGNRDIIEDGQNGFLLPYLDIENLIKTSKRLFSDSFRNQLKANLTKNTKEKFDEQTAIQKFIDIIENEV